MLREVLEAKTNSLVPGPDVWSARRQPLLALAALPISPCQPFVSASGLNQSETLNGWPGDGNTR